MAEFKEVLKKAQDGYHDRKDYPPFALMSWTDRSKWNEYLKKINEELDKDSVNGIGGQSMKKEIKELLNWTPEGVDLKAIGKVNYPEKYFPKKQYGEIVTDEDCKQPFFCESYLYPLLGKMDARTLLCLLERAFESLGVSIDDYKESEK